MSPAQPVDPVSPPAPEWSAEALVVGSGFAGAVTACRLAEAGVEVAILERGRRFGPQDLPAYPLPPPPGGETDERRDGGRDVIAPDASRLLWKFGRGLWDVRDLGDVVVAQAAGYGGGSLIYANVHLRAPSDVFEPRWPAPYTRAQLDPYYDRVAYMLQVNAAPEFPAKGCRLQDVADASEGRLHGFAPPLAVNFDREKNLLGVEQGRCDWRGDCCFGCPRRAKNTLDLNYLELAERHGAQVHTLAEALWIEPGAPGYVVHYRDWLRGGQRARARAQKLFLCAGAVGTTELLLRSRERGALPELSPLLGTRYFTNIDELAAVFESDPLQEVERGPTITRSLLYHREPDGAEERHTLAFALGERAPDIGSLLTQEGARAVLARAPVVSAGSWGEGSATGELIVERVEGRFEAGVPITGAEGTVFAVALSPNQVLGDWMLIQDGGMPEALEPVLGIFRSPLWLARNRFAETPESGAERGVRARPAYADLPFSSVADALGGVVRGAEEQRSPLAQELGGVLLTTLRRAREDDGLPAPWEIVPRALREALEAARERLLDQAALAAEPTVAGFVDGAVRAVPFDLRSLLESAGRSTDALERVSIPQLRDDEIVRSALQLGIQLIWGSEGELARAVAAELLDGVLPRSPGALVEQLSVVLRWALDYRHGDGHTALLLAMGRDALPGRLSLAVSEPLAPGCTVQGERSSARAWLVGFEVRAGSLARGDAAGQLLLGGLTGAFERGERLWAGGCAFGAAAELREVSVPGAAGGSFGLHALDFEPAPRTPARYRFAIERGRGTGVPSDEAPLPPVRARLPEPWASSERATQQRLLRDIAAHWKGELRTDPIWSAGGRRVSVHSQGGCAMTGRGDRSLGVTDPEGEVIGYPGLYVMDAAAFPTPVGVNPSATIAAVAEYKVEQCIRRLRGEAEWVPEQSAPAEAWARDPDRELDPIPTVRSEPPRHEPLGLHFKEVMRGAYWEPGSGPTEAFRAIETHLEVEIDDLEGFVARHRRGLEPCARVGGWLVFPAVGGPGESAERLAIRDGSWLRIMTNRGRDASGRALRQLEYRLRLDSGELRGAKRVRDDPGFDVWEDTTTLRFELQRDERRWLGFVRLTASDFFGTQLDTITASGTRDPLRQVWALGAFGQLFFGHLVDVYLPELSRRRPSAARAGRERG